ncbi:MAG: hypothetical protein AAF485_10015, partial [Chloroflexota bacterium]
YHLTSSGQSLITQLRDRSGRFLSVDNPPLPTDSVNQLAVQLDKLITLSLTYTDKPGIWCLAHSRNRAPAADAAPLLRINQYLSDFNAFRDDAHMAAWQSYNVEGYVWEAFSVICAKQASNADDVFEALSFRGYSRTEYAEGFTLLQDLGWLTSQSGHYQPSEEGQRIRATVEQLTDDYFYAPWLTLPDDELEHTKRLLQQFHDQLQALAMSDP